MKARNEAGSAAGAKSPPAEWPSDEKPAASGAAKEEPAANGEAGEKPAADGADWPEEN